ncbi:MAG: peptidylprolyl isomerase [Bacilli bacterium]|nr:peptidylprolyl isomerase [Bacilli bacterium]
MIKIYVKDYGVMSFELDYENAPISAKNFVKLAREGFYEGIVYHRIIKNFKIQCGGYKIVDGKVRAMEPSYSIKGEFKSNGVDNNISHERGVISMARTQVPDSACAQFFVCHKDAKFLDGEYAAFGHMIDGFDCLDKIAKVRTHKYDEYMQDSPYDIIMIEKVEVIDEPEE